MEFADLIGKVFFLLHGMKEMCVGCCWHQNARHTIVSPSWSSWYDEHWLNLIPDGKVKRLFAQYVCGWEERRAAAKWKGVRKRTNKRQGGKGGMKRNKERDGGYTVCHLWFSFVCVIANAILKDFQIKLCIACIIPVASSWHFRRTMRLARFHNLILLLHEFYSPAMWNKRKICPDIKRKCFGEEKIREKFILKRKWCWIYL